MQNFVDSIKHKNPFKNPVPEKIIYFWQEMIYKLTSATHLHPFIHTFHTYKYAHTHTHTHCHSLYIYNLCTLKKTSSILYISFNFFVWIQPFCGVMAETCFFFLLLFCAMQFIIPLEAVTKFNLHSESCFAH